MDKDFPCKKYAHKHKKDRPQMERPLPNLIIPFKQSNPALQRGEKLTHALQAAIQLSFRRGI
jgi:hypothetical protein